MRIIFFIVLLFLSGLAVSAQESRLPASGFAGCTVQGDIAFSDSYCGYIEACAQHGAVAGTCTYPCVHQFSFGGGLRPVFSRL